MASLVVLVLLVMGCHDDGDYPRGWSPLRAPATVAGAPTDTPAVRSCPQVAGKYRVTDSVIFHHLIGRRLMREQLALPWWTAAISGRTSDSLRVVLSTGTIEDTVWIARGRDYDCSGGWITGQWPEFLLRMWPPDSTEASRGYESTLAIATDEKGRLIGRVKTVSYREFAVWCGDGCRYVKIPFTRQVMVRWHRMSTERTADVDGGDPTLDSAANAKMARENAGLEAGTPLPPNAMQRRMMELERRVEAGDPPR